MNLTRSKSPPGRRSLGDRAASLVEYCLLVAMIALVCVGAISYFGSKTSGSVTSSSNSIATAG